MKNIWIYCYIFLVSFYRIYIYTYIYVRVVQIKPIVWWVVVVQWFQQ
jgi:hypothetical protein